MATTERQAALDAEGLNREVGLVGLMWASETSIIGSGWLFAALGAATLAGPSAILSWVVAGIIIIVLALVHAELGGLFPVTGGTSRFPHYAFGSFAGATFGWFSYLQAAAVAPIEVEAVFQYLSVIPGGAFTGLINSKGVLSWEYGIPFAVLLLIVFTYMNLVGIRWLARTNNLITNWKVAIPVAAIFIFLIFKFHGGNLGGGSAGPFFVPHAAIKTIFFAMPTAGIVFSLLGFEQAVQLGGESANPGRDLPRAVIGSILIGAAIYTLVQIAFIVALKPSVLAAGHGWLNIPTHLANTDLANLHSAPFATLAVLGGLGWFAWILRVDAFISPGGTGLIYLTSASRISFGLAKNGYIPAIFERTSSKKIPWFAVVFSAGLGLIFLLPFPSWFELVGVVTSASVMMYAGAPLALGALRRSKPDLPRPYRLPAAEIVAPIAFALANLVVYFSGWGVYSTLMVFMVIGAVLIGGSLALGLNPNRPKIDWNAAPWVVTYLVGMTVISYVGAFPGAAGAPGTPVGSGIINSIWGLNHTLVGGKGTILPFWWSMLVVIAFSLLIYYWAVQTRLPEQMVDEYVKDVYPPPLAE
ncbi:MAG: APC family permease [Acidimicrobiales bacterium]